jgi:hypothetical protein
VPDCPAMTAMERKPIEFQCTGPKQFNARLLAQPIDLSYFSLNLQTQLGDQAKAFLPHSDRSLKALIASGAEGQAENVGHQQTWFVPRISGMSLKICDCRPGPSYPRPKPTGRDRPAHAGLGSRGRGCPSGASGGPQFNRFSSCCLG